ncbi:MAG: hypothetical protein AAGI68_03695 [Planctomycetota bacterium]
MMADGDNGRDRFVYVLSGESERYARMLQLSISTLRRLHPAAEVIVCTDAETAGCTALWDGVRPLVDRIDVAEVEYAAGAPASRALKTTLALRVPRPFVFLDVDTLVVRSLPRVDEVLGEADFGAVRDRNDRMPVPDFPPIAASVSREMGWPHPTENYFNSGVMFWGDTEAATRLSTRWHAAWRRCWQELGDHRDQPALAYAVEAERVHARVIPDNLNALLDGEPRLARGARVVHCFTGGGQLGSDTLMAHLLERLSETGEVDWAAIDCAVARDDFWVAPGRTYARAVAQRHWGRAVRFGLYESLEPVKDLLRPTKRWLEARFGRLGAGRSGVSADR